MFKTIFTIFLIAHFIGDFYLQSDTLAAKKTTQFRSVLLHCAKYAIFPIIMLFLFYNKNLILCFCIFALLHFIIDSLKFLYLNSKISKPLSTHKIFITDQFVHIASIFILSLVMQFENIKIVASPFLINFATALNFNLDAVLPWVLAVLIICKPASIAVKILLSSFAPTQTDEKNLIGKANAGAFVGVLERIIILLFISIGQYSAIGLVLTAKSIARYNKISENQEFAEYYLLGTLLSTLCVIITYFLVF